ncbi:MAG: hypothetical protein Fues2KO_03720 [Fuerstiella sp.]
MQVTITIIHMITTDIRTIMIIATTTIIIMTKNRSENLHGHVGGFRMGSNDANRHQQDSDRLMSAVDQLESWYCLEVQRTRLLIERLRGQHLQIHSPPEVCEISSATRVESPAESADLLIRPLASNHRRAA